MKANFWQGFFRSIGCEYKSTDFIQGASGIKHTILCLGIDEVKKRIVVVQDEQDARILSMAQADLQARIKGYNVLMLRPVPINLSTAVATIGMLFGTNKLTTKDLNQLSANGDNQNAILTENKAKLENILNSINPQIEIIQKAKLSAVPVIKEVIQQLSHVKFITELNSNDNVVFDFEQLLNFNPVVYDTALGVCPLPLYDFTIEQADVFIKGKDLGHCKQILKDHSIYQFFYPPIDSLALGFIETQKYQPSSLKEIIDLVPDNGHPFGKNEIVDVKKVTQVIDELKERGYAVEGDVYMEITDKGMERRMQVKFKPRESIFKRLSYIFSFKAELNLRDLLNRG